MRALGIQALSAHRKVTIHNIQNSARGYGGWYPMDEGCLGCEVMGSKYALSQK